MRNRAGGGELTTFPTSAITRNRPNHAESSGGGAQHLSNQCHPFSRKRGGGNVFERIKEWGGNTAYRSAGRGTVPHFVGVNCARRRALGARNQAPPPLCRPEAWALRRGGGQMRPLGGNNGSHHHHHKSNITGSIGLGGGLRG